MDILTCDIELTTTALATIYAGGARFVQAKARDGREIRFPALALQRFVTHAGVRGTFVITIDNDRRLRSVERL